MPLRDVAAGDDRPLQEIADSLFKSHKIIVVSGAGISTSAGIPDFRSKDGLYNLIPDQTCLPTPPPSNPSTPSKKRTAESLDESEDTTSRKRRACTVDESETPPSSQSSTTSNASRRSSGATRLRGQDLFHARVWNSPQSASTFYRFIASLRQQIYSKDTDSTATHRFIRSLRDGGRLMRCYTQNIDGLESRVGLSMNLTRGKGNKRRFMKKNFEAPIPEQTENTDFDGGCEAVPLHGDLDKLRCTLCHDLFDWTADATDSFLEGLAPDCAECERKSDEREATGKRGLSIGSLRPNIVLYGEDHPSNTLLTPLIPFDIASRPEVLIIMGTSLKVFGLQKIVRDMAKAVHSLKHGRVIFVNRTRPAESVWDGIIDDFVAMDCDDWVEDIHRRRSDLWLRQGDIRLKVVKPPGQKKRKAVEDSADEVRPAKKPKIMVEIPAARPNEQKPKNPRKEKPTLQLEHSQTRLESIATLLAATQTPATPRKIYRALKDVNAHHPGRQYLSPLAPLHRPQPSPLRQFPLVSEVTEPANPSTPRRPPFSPLTPMTNTPARTMRSIFSEVIDDRTAAKSKIYDGKENMEVCWKNGAVKEAARVGLDPVQGVDEGVPMYKLSNRRFFSRLIATLGFD